MTLKGTHRAIENGLFSSKMRWRGWLEGATQTQAALDPRLRDSARSELGPLREEPGLEARGGMRLGGGCGKAGAVAGARTRGPSF